MEGGRGRERARARTHEQEGERKKESQVGCVLSVEHGAQTQDPEITT